MSPPTIRQRPRQSGILRVSPIFTLSLIAVLSGATQRSAHALTFQLTFDSSASTAPAGFLPAFNNAIQFYQTTFTDPITIKMQVGWGTIDNKSLIPGTLGESPPGLATRSRLPIKRRSPTSRRATLPMVLPL